MKALITSVFLIILCGAFVVKPVTIYYQAKYYTSIAANGNKLVVARRVVNSNPFYANRYVVLINMRQGKHRKRLSVYDIQTNKIVFQTRVMHGSGSGSGAEVPAKFSNAMNSNCTALGRYVVTSEYNGNYGQAFRLVGLDCTNSNAMRRSLVLHSTKYITNTKISYSRGCPAVSRVALNILKAYVRPGTLLWIYNN